MKKKVVTVKVSPQIYMALVELAKREGISVSELIRRAISMYLVVTGEMGGR